MGSERAVPLAHAAGAPERTACRRNEGGRTVHGRVAPALRPRRLPSPRRIAGRRAGRSSDQEGRDGDCDRPPCESRPRQIRLPGRCRHGSPGAARPSQLLLRRAGMYRAGACTGRARGGHDRSARALRRSPSRPGRRAAGVSRPPHASLGAAPRALHTGRVSLRARLRERHQAALPRVRSAGDGVRVRPLVA